MIRDGMKVSMDHFYPIRAGFFPIRDHLKSDPRRLFRTTVECKHRAVHQLQAVYVPAAQADPSRLAHSSSIKPTCEIRLPTIDVDTRAHRRLCHTRIPTFLVAATVCRLINEIGSRVVGTTKGRESRFCVTPTTGHLPKSAGEGHWLETVTKYAIACAIVGILPCSFPFLVGLEIAMVYHLSVVHRIPFRLGELGIIWAILVPTSFVLKVIVEAILVWFPGPGWIVKGAIAFGFVMLAGKLIDSYYATERSKLNN